MNNVKHLHINRYSQQQGKHCSLIIQVHQSRLQQLNDGQSSAENSWKAWGDTE